MSSPQITYRPCNDASAEVEVATVANIYRMVLSKNKQAAGRLPSPDGPDTRGGFANDSRARASISRTS
jgi:hypothetical protein